METKGSGAPASARTPEAAPARRSETAPLTPVTQPLLPPLSELVPYLEQIWRSKRVTNCGPLHEELEEALADYLGVPHLSLFANGTLALLAALKALNLEGEVVTTPYSFVATSHAARWCGLTPVFADVDPDSLNLDPRRVEAAITPRTTAILPVHCYGVPCDVDGIAAVAQRHGLRVVYDAAHAFGVKVHGESVLRYGDLSVLSFHATKVFNTFEGGAVVSPDAATKARIGQFRNFGLVDEVAEESVGLNGKMSEIGAALGLVQLKHVDYALRRRRERDAHYRRLLADCPGILPLHERPERANYSYFPVLVTAAFRLERDELYRELLRQGVQTRRYFYPLISDQPMYRHLPSATHANLPVAAAKAQQILCLPLFPGLAPDEVERIAGLIADAGR